MDTLGFSAALLGSEPTLVSHHGSQGTRSSRHHHLECLTALVLAASPPSSRNSLPSAYSVWATLVTLLLPELMKLRESEARTEGLYSQLPVPGTHPPRHTRGSAAHFLQAPAQLSVVRDAPQVLTVLLAFFPLLSINICLTFITSVVCSLYLSHDTQ